MSFQLHIDKDEVQKPTSHTTLRLLIKKLSSTGVKYDERQGGSKKQHCRVSIVVGADLPANPDAELDWQEFLERGNSIVMFVNRESLSQDPKISFFKKFGVEIRETQPVIATTYSGYPTPEVVTCVGGIRGRGNDPVLALPGAVSLQVDPPAQVAISSGVFSYPANTPIVALIDSSETCAGRIVVVASTRLVSDKFIRRERNVDFVELILKWSAHDIDLDLTRKIVGEFDTHRRSDRIGGNNGTLPVLPSISALCKSLLPSYNDYELKQDLGFFLEHFEFNQGRVGEVLRLMEKCGVHAYTGSPTIPEFENRFLPFKMALFSPNLPEIAGLPLELYDLDYYFSSVEEKIAALFSKCVETDTKIFIEQASELLGIGGTSPQEVLEDLWNEIFRMKMTTYV